METLLYRKPVKTQNVPTPGNVASIGATATQFRLKQSCPEMNSRFTPGTIGKKSSRFGSDSTNGDTKSNFTKTYPWMVRANVSKDKRLRVKGQKIVDLKVNQDRNEQPTLNEVPRYSWKLKVNEATSDYGSLFKDLPYGYGPSAGSILRGNNYPESTVILGINKPEDSFGELLYAQKLLQLEGKTKTPINFTPRYQTLNPK